LAIVQPDKAQLVWRGNFTRLSPPKHLPYGKKRLSLPRELID
jgi:hypothetical protein